MIRRSSFWLLLALALLFVVGLLAFHRIPTDYLPRPCADNFRIYGDLAIVLNCDSPEFMRLALQPDEIFEPRNPRQSRPGLVLLAASVSRLLQPITPLAEGFFTLQGRSLQEWTIRFMPTYSAFVLLNIAIWAVSLVVFVRLLPGEAGIPLAAALMGVVLVSNDVVKMFLLTPHTAMFAILVPLFCLWSYRIAATEGRAQPAKILLLSVVAGLGVTAYAAFVVFVPSVLLPLVVGVVHKFSRHRLAQVLLLTVLVTALVALPMAAWIAAVQGEAGSFYSEELGGYGQVVWIGQALQEGAFALFGALLSNGLAIAISDLPYVGFLLVYVLAIGLISAQRRSVLRLALRSFGVGPLVVGFLFVAFFAVVGLTADRVAFSAVPPIVVGSASVVVAVQPAATPRGRRVAGLLAFTLAGVFFTIFLLKTGPFS